MFSNYNADYKQELASSPGYPEILSICELCNAIETESRVEFQIILEAHFIRGNDRTKFVHCRETC